MTYKVSAGHDVALGSLSEVDPQPKSEGIKPTRRIYSPSGAVIDQGLYVELEYSVLEPTGYTALLAQFGLDVATTADVTVYVRDETFAWVRCNGKAVRPQPGRDVNWSYFPRNVTILIKNIARLSEPVLTSFTFTDGANYAFTDGTDYEFTS